MKQRGGDRRGRDLVPDRLLVLQRGVAEAQRLSAVGCSTVLAT